MGRKQEQRSAQDHHLVSWQPLDDDVATPLEEMSNKDIFLLGEVLSAIQKRTLRGRVDVGKKYPEYAENGILEFNFTPRYLLGRYNYNKADLNKVFDWLEAGQIITPIGYYGRGIPMPLLPHPDKLYTGRVIHFWFRPSDLRYVLKKVYRLRPRYFLKTKRITYNTVTKELEVRLRGALTIPPTNNELQFRQNSGAAEVLELLIRNIGSPVANRVLIEACRGKDLATTISTVRKRLGIEASEEHRELAEWSGKAVGIEVKKERGGYALIEY